MTKQFLHCIHSLNPQGGGPAQFIKQCALLQKDFSIEIEVLTLDPPSAEWIKGFPCKVHALGQNISAYGYSSQLIPWLKEQSKRFDLTVIDGLWQYSSFGTWLALRTIGAPYVVFPHGMLDPWFNERYPIKAIKKQLYWLLAESHVLKDARAVIFTAEDEMLRSRKSFWPYQAREVVTSYGTLPSPFDLKTCKDIFLSQYPKLKDKKLLLFLSRIHEKKGCALLLKSFAGLLDKHSDWHLVMAGPESNYSEQLQREFQSIEQSVTWTGMLENEMKWGALSAAEALVLPSHQENFARVVSESLSCGTPVLISKRVNIWREVIEDGAGLADDDDLNGTSRLLEQWLTKGTEARELMRAAARKCYENRFNMSVTFRRYLQCLESCMNSKQN